MNTSLTPAARWARGLTLTGLFGLIILLTAWNGWLVPPARWPVSVVLLLMVGPLMVALRGILHGKRYTHAWVSMLTLLYFIHGVVLVASGSPDRPYAALEILLSLMLYMGAILYVRLTRIAKQAEPADDSIKD